MDAQHKPFVWTSGPRAHERPRGRCYAVFLSGGRDRRSPPLSRADRRGRLPLLLLTTSPCVILCGSFMSISSRVAMLKHRAPAILFRTGGLGLLSAASALCLFLCLCRCSPSFLTTRLLQRGSCLPPLPLFSTAPPERLPAIHPRHHLLSLFIICACILLCLRCCRPGLASACLPAAFVLYRLLARFKPGAASSIHVFSSYSLSSL